MSTLMHKPTIEGPSGSMRRTATANPAFKPEIARSLRQHPVLAGVVAAVVLALLVVFALQQKKAYLAEALIYIEPTNSRVLGDGTGGGFDASKYESSVAQQMLTAQRVDILANALKSLPHQVWAEYGPTPQVAASVLQGQLKVARVSTSYQVSISLKGSNAQNTAAIVNAVTTAYLEAGRRDEVSQADQRSQLLREERTRIEAQLERDRAEQTRLGTTLGVASPGVGTANPYDSQLDALRSQLVAARAAHDQAASQLATISGSAGNHASGLTAAANDAIAADSGLSSMKATINARRAQLATQMAGLTPANPIYKSYQDELADLDRTLETMTVQMRDRAARNLQDRLRAELERTSDVEARTNAELARTASTATTASPRLQRAAELTADVDRLTARYTLVDNALHGLELETTGPGMAHLALAAAVPAAPEANKRRLILLAALPLALLCGLGAAVFACKRDKHIYVGSDIDDVLGFAPIAILPAAADVSSDVLDEYYLRLAAGVEGAYRSGNARTFLVTPVSAETDVQPLVQALNRRLLGLGLGVVVVEAGAVFAPQAPAATSTELAPGDQKFDRHYDGLAATLFTRLKAEHDVVLLESSALLISAQSEYVARCADVTLLVAESAVTTRVELYQAGALLQRLNVTGVGSVLTELKLRHADGLFVRGIRALEQRSDRAVRTHAGTWQSSPMKAPEREAEVEAPAREVWEPGSTDETEPMEVAMPAPMEDGGTHEYVPSADVAAQVREPEHVEAAESLPVVASEASSEPELPVSDSVRPEDTTTFDDQRDLLSSEEEPLSMSSNYPDSSHQGTPRNWFERLIQDDKSAPAAPSEREQPEWSSSRTSELISEDAESHVDSVTTRQEDGEGLLDRAGSEGEVAIETEALEVARSSQASEFEDGPESLAAAESPYDAAQEAERESFASSEPVQRPLSFSQLLNLQQARGQETAEELTPEPAAMSAGEPEPEAAVQVPPVTGTLRWEPIPPLRDTEEPWRISRTGMAAAGAAPIPPVYDNWGAEDPVHIAPVDRWGSLESEPAPEPAAESSDIVLTRRWGLLSRFQQGESFKAARALGSDASGEAPAEPEAESQLPLSIPDRRRR